LIHGSLEKNGLSLHATIFRMQHQKLRK
jgi:hypothetical protein